jgi:hypothetical protein
MVRFIVQNIENALKQLLQRRATRNGRSMEGRGILHSIGAEKETPTGGLGREIAALFGNAGLTRDISELRGREITSQQRDPRRLL